MYFNYLHKQTIRQWYFTRLVWYRQKSYKETLNIPVFPIPIKANYKESTDSRLPSDELYQERLLGQSPDNVSRPWFVLHDGPPYANGNCHVGHALNKILKDITVRHKLLSGYRVHFQPGWDCHGLPIELQAQNRVASKKDLSLNNPFHVRNAAREEITKWKSIQGRDFLRWGVLGSWDKAYVTMDPLAVGRQLRVFNQLHTQGLIKYELWPVYWSYSSRTALAEAELEYHEDHISPSVYVALKVANMEALSLPPTTKELFLVIWTTTPWTLPSNEAVAISQNMSYTILQNTDNNHCYVVASYFIEEFLQKVKGTSYIKLHDITGDALNSFHLRYHHPFRRDWTAPVLTSNHVTCDKGTGLVHVAPCHGRDDFLLGVEHNLPMADLVDEDACFKPKAGSTLAGLFVLKEGNEQVLKELDDAVLHCGDLQHSYPYDWRKRLPVIQMASKQWFIDTGALANTALKMYEEVNVFPPSIRSAMLKFIADRPKWCISRQRVWGSPIPIFFIKENDTPKPIVNESFIKHVASLIEERKEYDFWWGASSVADLVPSSLAKKISEEYGGKDVSQFVLSRDIFDIWMDSGLTWLSVLPDAHDCSSKENLRLPDGRELRKADLYLEGLDQFRGWFSSSLLLSIALTGQSPYKSLAVHGFTTDANGRKMSKSLGNVISPDSVHEQYGGWNTLRYWVAMSGFTSRPSIGQHVLKQHHHQWTSLRNTFRFLLGNLHGFSLDEELLPFDQLTSLDQLFLLELSECFSKVRRCYDELLYDEGLTTLEKLQGKLSSVYFTGVKDRLYCSPRYSHGHKSVRTTLHHLLYLLCISFQPILPHMIEEMTQTLFKNVQHPSWLHWDYGERLCDLWRNHSLETLRESTLVHCNDLRQSLLTCTSKTVENDSSRKVSQVNPLADVWIHITDIKSDPMKAIVETMQTEVDSCHSSLCEIIRCSRIALPSVQQPFSTSSQLIDQISTKDVDAEVYRAPSESRCVRCRRYIVLNPIALQPLLCPMCMQALEGQSISTSTETSQTLKAF